MTLYRLHVFSAFLAISEPILEYSGCIFPFRFHFDWFWALLKQSSSFLNGCRSFHWPSPCLQGPLCLTSRHLSTSTSSFLFAQLVFRRKNAHCWLIEGYSSTRITSYVLIFIRCVVQSPIRAKYHVGTPSCRRYFDKT